MRIIKKRKIKMSDLSASDIAKIRTHLQARQGIEEVSGTPGKKQLLVSYDLEKITLKQLIDELLNLGMHPADGFWQRMRRNMLYDSEKNEMDNMHAKPEPCCSNIDEILEKSKR